MSHADLLFELGTEELPPKSLMTLSKALELSIRIKCDDTVKRVRFGQY